MEPLFIAVLVISAISVSRAEESLSLFVRKGSPVHLDVQGYERLRFNTLYWHFNSTAILEYIIGFKLTFYNNYNISTEFDQKNFTLLLKNVQERDSGIYTAKITDIEGQPRDVASYRLTVQEAPPTPEVRVALLSSAEGICKVSVNCSANDTRASYICDHTHCTQVANTTLSTEFKITVTATMEAISCSSSNRVGTKTQSTKHVCTPIYDYNRVKSRGVTERVIVGVIVAAAIVISITVFVIYKKRRKSGGSQIQEKHNTEYASVEGPAVVLSNTSTEVTVYETVTTAKPEHHPKMNTVYDMLGPAGDPRPQPESVYATVNKGAS